MAWDPEAQPFKLTSERILGRRMEAAAVTYQRERAQIIEQLAARGLAQSGAAITQVDKLASDIIRDFGAAVVPELIELIKDACGDPPPPPALTWLRGTVESYVTGLVNSYTERAVAQRRHLHVDDKSAGHAMEVAGREVMRDLEIAIGKIELRSRFLHPPTEAAAQDRADYDVFISHASEDKATVAEPIAAELRARGLRPWLGKFELTIGDRLMSRIDEGLASSRYGVVVLSPAFFRKQWPIWELNALAALEATRGRKTILPVWHELTKEEVVNHSPLLAALLAVETSVGINAVVDEIEKALKR